MYITKPVSELSQTEKKFTAAFGFPLKKAVMTKLRAPKLSVIKLETVDAKPSLQREDINVDSMTEVGAEALRRAAIEAERRVCGNKTNEVTGAYVQMSLADKLSAFLDLRTCLLVHIADTDLKEEMVTLLKNE